MQKSGIKKRRIKSRYAAFFGGDDQRPAALRMSLGRLQLLLR